MLVWIVIFWQIKKITSKLVENSMNLVWFTSSGFLDHCCEQNTSTATAGQKFHSAVMLTAMARKAVLAGLTVL